MGTYFSALYIKTIFFYLPDKKIRNGLNFTCKTIRLGNVIFNAFGEEMIFDGMQIYPIIIR